MEYLEVTARSGLKIRELPSGSSRVLEAMPAGMRVRRLDRTLWNGDWYKIFAQFSDTYQVEGYSHRKYLARIDAPERELHHIQPEPLVPPPPPPPPPPPRNVFRVNASSLRLREEPSTSSQILMDMPHGMIVTKIEDSSELGWWKISAKAGNLLEEGFAASKYLISIDPEPAPRTALTDLRNIADVISRVQRFVGDYANALNEELLLVLNQVVAHYEIGANPRRFSHFMAQLAHESAHFTRMEENLNYSTNGLMAIFRSKFRDEQEAASFARQPERIANRVYANRIGNGDEASGDGWRYRGRGFIQLTGRANYRDIGRRLELDLENDPDVVASNPVIALQVAANYWDSRNLNEAADADDIFEVTRLINGGLNGIEDRQQLLAVAKSIWGG
ncbi:MAG: SH3 domain-containing protein [Pseudomonadota bacterium]